MKSFSLNSAIKTAVSRSSAVKYVSEENFNAFVNAVMKAYGVGAETKIKQFPDGNQRFSVVVDKKNDAIPTTAAGTTRSRIGEAQLNADGTWQFYRIDCGMLPKVAEKYPVEPRKETTEEPAEEPETFSVAKKATATKRTAKKADTPTETPKAGKVTTARRRRSA